MAEFVRKVYNTTLNNSQERHYLWRGPVSIDGFGLDEQSYQPEWVPAQTYNPFSSLTLYSEYGKLLAALFISQLREQVTNVRITVRPLCGQSYRQGWATARTTNRSAVSGVRIRIGVKQPVALLEQLSSWRSTQPTTPTELLSCQLLSTSTTFFCPNPLVYTFLAETRT